MKNDPVGCTVIVVGAVWTLVSPYAIWLSQHTTAQPKDMAAFILLNVIMGVAVTMLGSCRVAKVPQ